MAKRLQFNYVFTPGAANAGTIVFDGAVSLKRLLIITNVTSGAVLYNFADPAKGASVSYNATTGKTTVTLETNTSSMSATDDLQVFYENDSTFIQPVEPLLDPVDKFRVTQPQALIDTDFEYGLQTTKWENLGLVNNRPFAFPSEESLPNISSITMNTNSRTVTVAVSSGVFPSDGTPIFVYDTFLNIANGNFTIESGGGTNTITYTGKAVNTTNVTSLFDANKTQIFRGTLYTSAAIGGSPTITYSGTDVTVVTSVPHGLAIGNEVAIVGTTASSNPPNGTFPVSCIVNSTTFRVFVNNAPTGTVSGGSVYVLPQSQFLHRPFDGGILFSNNANGNFEQGMRQTRRYFRYQSGKGIQVSSGTILKPNYQVDSLTSSGTTVTVQTKEQHNILPGSTITVSGANETAYNGTFEITNVTGYNTFQYTAGSTPTTTIASGNFVVSVNSWYGSKTRLGLFDSQNGIFFEHDGQQAYVCRRSSTFQLSGRVSVVQNSNTVSQTNSSFPTYFAKQLNIGDFIIIRGMSYRVIDIASDTSMTISPSYRGANADYVTISRTVDLKIPQSEWNLDRMDGTGPSGYNIDFNKMQMFYIDYSWYGAGYIRWGFRADNGNVKYCHKLVNNNVNSEAYMRSGNLPARYEVESIPPTTRITSTLNSGDTTVGVASTGGFPPRGTVVVRNASTYEYVNYNGISGNTLTGLTRGLPGNTQTLSISSNTNVATASTTNVQVGMRVIGSGVPDNTFVTAIRPGELVLSKAVTTGNPSVTIVSMGASTGQTFTFSALDPVAVELAYPTFSPSISHWGTSVIMDGRFDDDKSLVFTFGQRTATSITAGATRALLSIRVAPSVDNGIGGLLGQRELINRMQLVLRALDITSTGGSSTNLLVQAILNGIPSTSTAWTNAVGGSLTEVNSSLAQIASYAGGSTTISGGEVTAGFFVGAGAQSVDLDRVRDLGNSILGGGTGTSNTGIYPDGPDTLSIIVTNLGSSTVTVFGRLSWTEAQA